MRCVVASESSAWRSLSEVVGEVLVGIATTSPAEDEMAAQAAAIRGIGRANCPSHELASMWSVGA
jgi:hypothetical protein